MAWRCHYSSGSVVAGVRFSLAELLNQGWGLVAGKYTGTIEQQLKRHAFRSAVVKAIQRDHLAGYPITRRRRRALKKLIGHGEFVFWAFEPLTADVSDGFLRLATEALRDLDHQTTSALAEDLFATFTKVAVQQSEPAMQVVLAHMQRSSDVDVAGLRDRISSTTEASDLDQAAQELARAFVRTFELFGAPRDPPAAAPGAPAPSRASPDAVIVRHITGALERAGQPQLVPDTWTHDVVLDLRGQLSQLVAEQSRAGATVDDLIEAREDSNVLVTALEAMEFAGATLGPRRLTTEVHRRARNALLPPSQRRPLPTRELDRFVDVLRHRPAGTGLWTQAVHHLTRLAEHSDQSGPEIEDALHAWARRHDVDPGLVHAAIEASGRPTDVRLLVDFWAERQPPDEVPARMRATLFVDGTPQQRRMWRLRSEDESGALQALGEAVAWAQDEEPGCRHVDVVVPDALLALRAERVRAQIDDRGLDHAVATTTDLLLRYAVRVASPRRLVTAGEKCRRIHENPAPVEWLDAADLDDPQRLFERLVDKDHSQAVALRICPFPDHLDGLVSAVLTTPYVIWPEGSWTSSGLARTVRRSWDTFPAHLVEHWREQARRERDNGQVTDARLLRAIWDDEDWLNAMADRAQRPYTPMDEL